MEETDMPRIKKKRIIGGGLISMMIVMMFSGCVSKGNPEGASGENISETASMDYNRVRRTGECISDQI